MTLYCDLIDTGGSVNNQYYLLLAWTQGSNPGRSSVMFIFVLLQPHVPFLHIADAERGGRMYGSLYPGGPRFESIPESDCPSEGLSVRLDRSRNVARN
jgi:hypothetical protein